MNAVPVGGGCVAALATDQRHPASVAVNGTHVYWVNFDPNGTVKAVPLGGGRVTTLASGQNLPDAVAVDRTHVYWADANGGR